LAHLGMTKELRSQNSEARRNSTRINQMRSASCPQLAALGFVADAAD
jgi:hypothetical protein